MTGKAHAALGAAIGGIVAYSIKDTGQQAVIMSMAVLGSLTPDIDHVKSRISQKYPVLAVVISKIFGHRNFLHSPAFVLILWILLHASLPGIAFVYGYGGHLLQDLCTKGGIPLLQPLSKKKYAILPFKTGSMDFPVTSAIIAILIGISGKL